jgi:uncharacterized membrane-anchored protein
METSATEPATHVSVTQMRRDDVDIVSLVGGIAVATLGALLLLDVLDAIHLRFAALAPLACAALGGVLLARGLEGGGGQDGR